MKKLLVAVLACALFVPAFAVENVKLTGDIQTIGLSYNDRGTTLVGNNLKGTTNRVTIGFTADLVDDVQAKVTLTHRNVFGMDSTLATYPQPYLTGENLDTVWANTFVSEAFVNITNIFDAMEVKVGRQYYGDVNSAVLYFGPDYGYAVANTYASLDGVRATYSGENFALTAAYFSLANTVATLPYSVSEEDMNLGGLDLALKANDNIGLDAYIYEFKNEGTDTLGLGVNHFGFWGVKPTIEYEHFKLGAEYTRNYSLGNDKGWQVKADLALPIGTEETSVTPRVTYLKSEKNFQAFGNYRPGLMFGTVLVAQGTLGPVNNILGGAIANWEVLNAGLCMKFANLEKWGFGLDFYTGETDGTFMGNSWEAKIVYNVNQYANLNLTGAMLTNAGHSWKHSPTAVQLGMNIKF